MRALLKKAEPGATLTELNAPEPGPGEALLRVMACSVCGTDLHLYRWDAWARGRVHPPLVFGHEMSGQVVALGPGAEGVKVGDHVSAETHLSCGHCLQCRTGRRHICQKLRIVGVDAPGIFSEYAVLPTENLWVNDQNLPWEIATLQEPFGNAVYTVMDGPGVSGKTVLITGCGPIGLMAILVARACGASLIIASDPSPRRLELARRLGADLALDPREDSVVKSVMDATRGDGADALLEFSGNTSALRQGLQALTYGGQANLLGIPESRVELDLAQEVIFKAVTLRGITGRRVFETWYQVRELVVSGRVDLRPLISHQVPIGRYQEVFEAALHGEAIKPVLFPQER